MREGGAGARSLEAVGRKAKDVSRKLRSARANLTNCKKTLGTLETVLRQSLLINKLEAGQNRLTQDNWRLRGSSRGGLRPRPRGRSWKAGCLSVGMRSRGARGSWCRSGSCWRRPRTGVRA